MPIQAAAIAPLTDQDRTVIRNRIAKFDDEILALLREQNALLPRCRRPPEAAQSGTEKGLP